MSEIRTDHEVLVVRTEAAQPAVRESRTPEEAGNDGGVLHRYGPHVEIRRTQPLEIGGAPVGIAPPASAIAGTLSVTEQLGIEAFALRNSSAYREAKANRPRDGEPWDMPGGCTPGPGDPSDPDAPQAAMVVAPGTAGDVSMLEAGPGSPVLEGSVGVGIIIVNGPTAATQFLAAERVKLVAEAQAGLTWLAGREPSAGVSWHYEITNVSIATPTNARAASNEVRWRNPTMAVLGHTQDWQGVVDYVTAMRARLDTRWAYCVFFVKGYPLDHFAYALAPRVVMDYANDDWGPDNLDRVFTHETGHIFSAADEYSTEEKACSCTSVHGIYSEPNGNCDNCAPNGGVSCLMRANDWTLCLNTRRHLGWALSSARVPQGAPVHVVSRSRDKLDIFFTDFAGRVMSAAWEPAMPVWWEGFWHIRGGMAAAGAPVTAVSRGPDKLDIFVVSTDNRVYTAAWRPDSGGWQGWWRIDGITVPHHSPIHAVSRSADKIDIFATDTQGRVMTAAWEPGFTDGWHGWWHIKGGRAAPGAPVTAVARAPDKLDIFIVGTDGHVYTAAWTPQSQGWQGWWRVGNSRFPAGSEINAVSRSLDKLDIFGTGIGGHTLTAAWEPAFDGWHGWWHIRDGLARPGAPIHVASRAANKLDAFVTGIDGHIFTAAWEPGFSDGWQGWWALNGGRATQGAPVTAVSRSKDKLDVFVVGGDIRIWTAAWEPGFTDWWHGWYPMGA